MKHSDRARQLRRDATEVERRLWRRLRDRQLAGHKFRRQHAVGPYIADFACPERRLIVELDGGQHDQTADARRDADLARLGYRVIRFWNHEVLQHPEAVLQSILKELEKDPT
jgi:very-short-patch-repair endonuclease